MSNLLVTSGNKSTWGKNEKIFFLGEWCLDLNNLSHLENRKYEVLKYHWRDFNKLSKDYQYLDDLNEKLLIALMNKLNKIHKCNYTIRQWRIVIGVFLYHFISITWDRYESLKLLFNENNIDQTYIFDGNIDNLTSRDFDEFDYVIRTHNWNFIFIGDIIKRKFKNKIKKFTLIRENNISLKKREPLDYGIKFFLKKLYDKVLGIFNKKFKVVFSEHYLDFISLLKISFSLKQIPRYHYEFKKVFKSYDNIMNRDKIKLDIKTDNDFEQLVCDIIFRYIPQSYLENFKNINIYTKTINIQTRAIYTAIGHLHNDVFNIWTANQLNYNAKIFVSQHGGCVQPKLNGNFFHQEKISDIFLVWHDKFKNNHHKISANKLLKLKNKKYFYNKSKYLTIIGYEGFMYTCRAQSTLNCAFMKYEIKDSINFYHRVAKKIREYTKFRYGNYSSGEGWHNSKERIIRILGKDVISNTNNLLSAFKNSKMLVCKYPQTTFSEALNSSIPTILLFDNNYWKFNEFFNEAINILKEGDLIFYNSQDAANHINKYWDNLDDWWLSDKTINARKKFISICSYNSENWLEEWKNFFNDNL